MREEQQQQIPGTMCWNEISTPDMGGTVEFYSQLMGWTTERIEMPDGNSYTMFKQGEKMIGGCIDPDECSDMPAMWLSYILVDDIDAATEKAKALGANIIKERVDLPMGSFVLFSDPQGAVIAFWQNNPDAC
ncbi:VOC family protein [Pontiellaceae bacterium B1224]|nr:VOC family protein [Pontiellaceae bacterium B1224]